MLEDSLGHKLITILEAMRSYTKEPLAKLGITHGHFIIYFRKWRRNSGATFRNS